MSLSFVTRSDAGARLTEVANTAANGEQIGVRYTLALDDQRTEAIEESGAKWQYGYDNLKQLVTAKKTDTQATVIPPLDQSYAYDPMGNRRTYADQTGSTAYAANSANQYTAVGGVASVYDRNGNLLTDGVKNYTWDAENQLTSVTPINPTEGSQKVEYTYDWRMRRTGKKSYTYTAGAWVLGKTTGFKYHEWNPIQETITPASGSTENKYYVWGNDLSGDLHEAGGVGGLLSMKYNRESYFYAYDGNGNVRALVKADAANPAASGIVEKYAYDGFGRALAGSGPINSQLSPINSFKFSTKQLDAETGMNYYGYRYYAEDAGRWINRDLIREIGGINIHELCNKNALYHYDLNGNSPAALIGGIVAGLSGALSGATQATMGHCADATTSASGCSSCCDAGFNIAAGTYAISYAGALVSCYTTVFWQAATCVAAVDVAYYFAEQFLQNSFTSCKRDCRNKARTCQTP